MKTRLLALFAVLTLVLALSAGPALAQGSVSMEDNFFSPATETITVGQSVTWTNNGASPHTSTGPTWDSGTVNPGGSFTFTFNTAGTFDYICEFHVALGMTGTVVVQAAGDGDGTLPPTGPSSRSAPFVFVGLALLLGGAAVLLAMRRRRA